jgi:hypothetical protein
VELKRGLVLYYYNFGTHAGGSCWGRHRLALCLSHGLMAMEADTRFSLCIFVCLFLEVFVYTLYWCYLAYGAVCVARSIVSDFWFLTECRYEETAEPREVCMESVVIKYCLLYYEFRLELTALFLC